ncbi:MAG: DUF1343 domain-containing protein [Bacteroidetes bacterium]|nr:DUF1343 domain-containing protein [Bacteroidota bacterium]
MRFFFSLVILSFNMPFLVSQVGIQSYTSITTGAQQIDVYLPKLKNKKVAIVTNASGIIGNKHLVDTLLKHKVKIVKIFGPEHGFRGTADAGEKVKGGKDALTNITVISLYGSHKKPTKEDLKGVDIVIYDIQDVGVRFYTYISTMTYVMEACAENNKELLVFDRPNPNGFYIDGPVMTDKYTSFLGMHHIPIVYAMTCGEYAQMVNGEGWLKNKLKCNLSVIPLKNYDRSKFVSGLPVKPSPNLPNDTAVLLYPGLGLFEGTIVSLGRGTPSPFQLIGSPYSDKHTFQFSFTPKPTAITKKPKYQDTVCYGMDLRPLFNDQLQKKSLNVSWVSQFYKETPEKQSVFFDKNFNYHAGNEELQEQLIGKVPEKDIRASWQPAIEVFKQIRQKYLIYKDF